MMASEFPRALSKFELDALAQLLPEDRTGYLKYRTFAERSMVIGEGRWGTGDLFLAEKISPIDLTAGMTPVVTFGEFSVASSGAEIEVTVTINEPQDEQLEVQFASDVPLNELAGATIIRSWTTSLWSPGSNPPIREVPLRSASGIPFVFAVNAARRMLWVHHTVGGFNQLIPVTGFYEYLLRSHPPKDKKASLSARAFFDELPNLTDEMLRTALLHYNLENRKFDASALEQSEVAQSGFLQRLRHKITGQHG
jgi:hypothetical protein